MSRKLKEFWCQEKYDFCRVDGTNPAHQEVAANLKAMWELCHSEQTLPYDLRRKLLRDMIVNEDANWRVSRSPEAMETLLDCLMLEQ